MIFSDNICSNVFQILLDFFFQIKQFTITYYINFLSFVKKIDIEIRKEKTIFKKRKKRYINRSKLPQTDYYLHQFLQLFNTFSVQNFSIIS